MTRISTRKMQPQTLLCLAVILVTTSGCASLNLPGLPIIGPLPVEERYQGVDGSYHPQSSVGEQTYHSVRRARSENAIVLQVVGDEPTNRVLPLPPEGKTVYVSNLLKQSGVQKKLGNVEATLFRHSTDSIGGLPMAVKMSRDGQSVLPDSDYALQAGDRLQVRKANLELKGLVNTFLGL